LREGALVSGSDHRSSTAPVTRRSLSQAVATAIALLSLFGVAFVLGDAALFVFVAAAVATALFELLDAVAARGGRPVIPFGIACGLGLLGAAYVGEAPWFVAAVGVTAAGSALLALRPGRGPAPLGDAAWTLLGVVWLAGGGAAAVAVMRTADRGERLLIVYLLVVALTDIAAFFAGTALGRHRLAPSVSPAKSWEGLAAGVVCALAAGALGGPALAGLGPLEGLGLGLVCGILAPVGDLVESLAKRELGIKDSGRLLPGHGGVLDRLDAMIFCSPAVLVYLGWLGA